MTRSLLFEIVSVGSVLLPILIALIIVALPRPRAAIARSVIAIAAAWSLGLVYTAYVYNPAGIAAGRELGWDSPDMRFDNNTIASQLIGGWIYPAIAVALFIVIRRRKRSANKVRE